MQPSDSRADPVAAVLNATRAVLGTPGTSIALHEPEFAGREWEYVKDCIDTGWVSSAGTYVDRFERQLAEACEASYAIAAVNGTAALHACLLLAGVQAGDEVLVPALTFIATANAVAYVGAIPHFVDAEPRSLGVGAAALDGWLQERAEVRHDACHDRATGRRIRALVVMHVFGHPCDLDALADLADRWRLVLVEDAAESLGSLYKGRHTGTFGLLGAVSFNGNKVVTTGGGGAVLTNDAALAQRARHLTTTARVPHRWSFIHDETGFNYRMPNLNAALGCAQLEQLDGFVARKRRLAAMYAEALDGAVGASFLHEPPHARSNYWLNAVLLSPRHADRRDALLAALNDGGYMARPVWTLMHRLPMYAACPRMPLPVAESLEARIVNLPSSARLAGGVSA